MHTLTPNSRTYYIAMDADGNVTGSGYVDPGERLDCGAARFQTYQTPEAMNTALAGMGGPADLSTIDINADVAVQRLAMCAKVNEMRALKLGLPVGYLGSRFDSDPETLTNLIGVITAVGAGVPLPPNFVYRTTDNVNVPMAAEQLVGLAAAMLAHRWACFTTSWRLKTEIEASSSPILIDIVSGWPG